MKDDYIKDQLPALLETFCCKDDSRPSLRKPIMQDGYLHATNTHIAIRIRKDLMPSTATYIVHERPDFARVFFPRKYSATLNTKLLGDAIKETCGDNPSEFIDCPECGGFGKVEWEYIDKDRDTHCRDFECPICDGDGSIQVSKHKVIVIDESKFSAVNLDIIHRALEFFKTENCLVGFGRTPADAWLLSPFEGVDMLIMPLGFGGEPADKYIETDKINL